MTHWHTICLDALSYGFFYCFFFFVILFSFVRRLSTDTQCWKRKAIFEKLKNEFVWKNFLKVNIFYAKMEFTCTFETDSEIISLYLGKFNLISFFSIFVHKTDLIWNSKKINKNKILSCEETRFRLLQVNDHHRWCTRLHVPTCKRSFICVNAINLKSKQKFLITLAWHWSAVHFIYFGTHLFIVNSFKTHTHFIRIDESRQAFVQNTAKHRKLGRRLLRKAFRIEKKTEVNVVLVLIVRISPERQCAPVNLEAQDSMRVSIEEVYLKWT